MRASIFSRKTPPPVICRLAGASTSVPDSTNTFLSFTSVDFDPYGLAELGANQIRVRRSGLYRVGALVAHPVGVLTDPDNVWTAVVANSNVADIRASISGKTAALVSPFGVTRLAAGDQLRTLVAHSAGSSQNYTAQYFMFAEYIEGT